MTTSSRPPLKSAAVGAFCGALVFFALDALRAQTALTVAAVKADPKPYVGTKVSVTGVASNIRSGTKGKKDRKVPCIKLSLFEVDNKGKRGSHYIFVSLPTSAFRFIPNEGDLVAIEGTLKWPYEIAAIDE